MLSKKLNAKKTKINDFLIVYRERDEHTPYWKDPYQA
jgi:hypothetical protein